MDSIRQQKVSRLIQKELSALFQNEVKHLAKGQIVSVTAVRVTPDLSFARVYASVFPTKQPGEFIDHFNESINEIRYVLFPKIRNDLRIMPDIQFYLDDTLDKAARIEDLLS